MAYRLTYNPKNKTYIFHDLIDRPHYRIEGSYEAIEKCVKKYWLFKEETIEEAVNDMALNRHNIAEFGINRDFLFTLEVI